MAIVGDLAGFKKAQKKIAKVAGGDPSMDRALKAGVVRAIKDLVKDQFLRGVGPDGSPQKPRRDGAPGLQSEKLARGALDARVNGNQIVFFAKKSAMAGSRVDQMLEGHQSGVTFPKRKGGGAYMRRDAKGKLISHSAFIRKTRDTARVDGRSAGSTAFVKERTLKSGKIKSRFVASRDRIAEHSVGPRVLPQRPIYPIGSMMPARWTKALDESARAILEKWAGSVVGTGAEKLRARWSARAA